MEIPFGNGFVCNGKFMHAELFDGTFPNRGESVYEVLRSDKGRPVFFNDHLERLKRSALLSDYRFNISEEELRGDIRSLSNNVRLEKANLKVVYNAFEGGVKRYLYYVMPSYPDEVMYRDGVKATLYKFERENPGAKIVRQNHKEIIAGILRRESAYEVMLVNRHGYITEGSRSNLFFIKDDLLYTAPEEMILKGITRDHILQICREEGIVVRFEAVHVDRLSGFSSVVMTGTSPVVLPFSFIDGIGFSTDNPVSGLLLRKMHERMASSVNDFTANH